MAQAIDRRAPMASAPFKYRPDGRVDWGTMWQSFCALALDGGPPHRGDFLPAPTTADPTSLAYQEVAAEICRGIQEVSGLAAFPAEPGWIAVPCSSAAMASWLATAILAENVAARAEGSRLLVPCGEHFTLKEEIKNVITAVAKTTHYWQQHLPTEVKTTLTLQTWLGSLVRRLRRGRA
ncbi:MAG: hypothetical protein K6U89_02510 [Chloroflexi bacterium]|nr:hypothetical protein [Chloroflexota bacterium]